MTLSTAASFAGDPNVAVALAASQYRLSDTVDYYRFSEPPALEHTNIPTRLTGLCATPLILRNVLDSLVAVSASTSPTGNESIACALRLDPDHPTRPAVELILSSHEPIRKGTVRYLKKIWRQMLEISALPKRNVDREPFVVLLTAFRHTVYAHTLRKLRSDFAKHMALIDYWKAQNVTENGELLAEFGCGDDACLRESLVETLLYLERCRSVFARMREDVHHPKRIISTKGDFLLLVAVMELASQAADRLLANVISLRVLSMRCFNSKHVLTHTFQSITSLPRHIVELLHFSANHMDSLHSHTLLLTLVSPVLPPSQLIWPQTNHEWDTIREFVSRDGAPNQSSPKSTDVFDLRTSPDNLVVHGELSLITYLHALYFHSIAQTSPRTSGNPHPLHLTPLNYIAVTSPPCAPSALWIDTYNARHASRGDGLRFDIALDFFVHWGASSVQDRGWRWIPLPPVPDFVKDANGGTITVELGPLSKQGSCEAEERIVTEAWDAYVKMVRPMV